MYKKVVLIAGCSLLASFSALAQYGMGSSSANEFKNTVTWTPTELSYNVISTHKQPIKKEVLNNAKLISNVIRDYPSNWITDYISVEITATCNGKITKAVSSNQELSTEQKNILKALDIGTNLVINVNYIHTDEITKIRQTKKMDVAMTVIPEVEAQYVGGHNKLMEYLKMKCKNILAQKNTKEFDPLVIKFIINELGEVTNARIVSISKDQKTDKLILDVINKMPKWTPAENGKGIKVKQEFEFSVGNYGC